MTNTPDNVQENAQENAQEPAHASDGSTPGGAHSAASEATVGAIEVKTVRGKKFLFIVAGTLLLVFAGNFAAARYNKWQSERRRADAAVIRDVARVTQEWTTQPDGMTVVMRAANPDDRDAVRRIRRHLRFRRSEYLRADYSDPKFGADDIPGRADLEFGTQKGQLNCRYRGVDGGGELRWITSDDIMLDSLREWATKVATSPVRNGVDPRGQTPEPVPSPDDSVSSST